MIKENFIYFLYQKDFTESGNDRYFLYKDSEFLEVESYDIISLDQFLITHDFWLISNSLYKKHGKLPLKVIDIVLFSKIVEGVKSVKEPTQPWDISQTIKPLYKNSKDFDKYISIYYRKEIIDMNICMLFSHKLAEYTDSLLIKALNVGEYERFFSLELPVYNKLVLSACRGIRVCKETIKHHKERLKLDFYRELKIFAEKHNVLYELPSDEDIKEKLIKLGYNLEDYSLEFLIDFLPSLDGYTDDLRNLQKTNKSYRIFNSISSTKSRISPIVESHLTSTARIYHKSPSIQNISKRYRDIFISDNEFHLCYVDYDQFEVGIMAALSNDPKMMHIYENMDAYKDLSKQIFNNESYRKKAKIIFLSYTYGMSLENILRSISQLGGDQKIAKKYFSEFTIFESWKNILCNEFQVKGKISSICSNYLNRKNTGQLSDKEQRTAVNHVVQGSASYIFKMALLELSKIDDIQILIPMHDAVLFQYKNGFDTKLAVTIFENTMTDILGGKIRGKASLQQFYQP
ncbi:MAG: DNA polymerase [Pseudomonadota bacterium]